MLVKNLSTTLILKNLSKNINKDIQINDADRIAKHKYDKILDDDLEKYLIKYKK